MKIENYRPYRGPVDIDFASGDKNVTIIQGRNDAGKTSFINAITWCLYGTEPFKDEGLEDRWNKSYVRDINVGSEFPVKVEILMEDSLGRNVRFIREQIFVKTDNLQCKHKSTPTLTIFRGNDEGDDEKIIDTENYIETHIPRALQEYFMFTGERLTQFFNKDHNYVKEGVHTLYQLDLLENIVDQLRKWENYYGNKFGQINPVLEEYKSKKSQLIESQKEDNNKLRDNKKSIEIYRANIKSWQNQIGSEGGDVKEIQNDIESITQDKIRKDYELKDAKKEYSKLIVKNLSNILSYPLLDNLEKWEDFEEPTKVEDNNIVSIGVKDLKRLLKQEECMCGNHLTPGSDSYVRLAKLLEVLENTEKSGVNIENIISNILSLSQNIKNRYPKDIDNEMSLEQNKIIKLDNEIKSKEIDIDGLKLRLENMNIDYINELNNKIEDAEDFIEGLIEENGILKDNLKFYPEAIAEIQKDIDEAEKKMGVKNELAEKRDFCEEMKNKANDIYNELAYNIHVELSDKVTEEYKQIHWKPEYKRVIIEQDFSVYVEKDGGDLIAATDPSTGSRNVLALTFMAALNSLSTVVLPQIIDTPIASLDKEMRTNVAKSLPGYMHGKQMILLVMDSEYTGDFKDNINEYVGEKYLLNYSDGETHIDKFEE